MKTKRNFLLVFIAIIGLCPISIFANAQNIGIGVPDPLEKLHIKGAVFPDSIGFKSPDGSVQTRAYNSFETQDAADERWIIIMDIMNPFFTRMRSGVRISHIPLP